MRTMFGGAPRPMRSATRTAMNTSADAPARILALLIAGSPRDLRHDVREIRPPQHVVERAELAAQDLAQLPLRPLQPLLQLLVYGGLLVRRLEVGARQTVGEIPELLHQLRSPPHAVLTATGR